jgi:hypothetical protein
MQSLVKQHRAWVMALAWWYVRRSLKRRAERTVAGIVSGETLALAAARPSRRWWKWLLAITLVGGVAWLAWRRLGGGGGDDDWSSWEPSSPEPPATEFSSTAGESPAPTESPVPAGA